MRLAGNDTDEATAGHEAQTRSAVHQQCTENTTIGTEAESVLSYKSDGTDRNEKISAVFD